MGTETSKGLHQRFIITSNTYIWESKGKTLAFKCVFYMELFSPSMFNGENHCPLWPKPTVQG